jgi:hypothetical protein
MLTKEHLQLLAAERLREAERLLEYRHWSGAYYLAGYAAELGLKAVVAARFKADAIPDRGLVNGVYTHNLAALINHAQLGPALSAELETNFRFARNWEQVRNWSEDARYRVWPETSANDLVSALGEKDGGVFRWIQAHW